MSTNGGKADHEFVTESTVEGMREKFRENLANPLCAKPGCDLRMKDHPSKPLPPLPTR